MLYLKLEGLLCSLRNCSHSPPAVPEATRFIKVHFRGVPEATRFIKVHFRGVPEVVSVPDGRGVQHADAIFIV